ncbi:CU044_5270 family protein [Virgisporangium ochraceum]|uniref:CU044_5270 family protein n=1 Tax=Virgisporangium ochraceum TaxID=65505 RepID=A0A8J3ZZ62_9ACTN|nr:CU044_5270 family protein [Virgisporangium ochraceum]GIJ72737.1 hypothetical protein Voc01_076540 [Virgisporangium ochraceum]
MSETQLREMFSRHADTPEPPLPPRFVADTVDAGHRRVRQRRAARAATGGVAAVAALAVAATAVLGPGGSTPGRVPDAIEAPRATGSGSATDAPADAVALLGRIALASAQRRIDIRDDQFIYEKRQFATQVSVQVNPAGEVAGTSEAWTSVDGSKTGWHIMPDKRGQLYSGPHPGRPEWGLSNPSYKYLTSLTTDPDTLLAQIRASVDARPTKPDQRSDRDQEAFDVIGHVLNWSMLPPQLGAALYAAAAKIPGVTMIPLVTDLAGRPGIAVARTGPLDDSSTWIFDRNTYEFLGGNTRRGGKEPGGGSYAILTRAVVDDVQQRP